jgi:hypothetical protein
LILARFQCPACGATLADPGQGSTVRCSYCQTSVILPQELVAARGLRPPGFREVYRVEAKRGALSSLLFPNLGIIYQDDFSNPRSGWDVGGREGGITLGYEGGTYRIYLPEDDSSWESYADLEVSDIALDVDVARFRGPKDGKYGVTCRAGDVGAYVFWITGAGYYGLGKVYYTQTNDVEDEYVDLDEGDDRVLRTGLEFNRLCVTCVGQTLTMYLNGYKVLQADDDEFDSGDIGLMVTTGESGRGGLEVRFMNLVLRAV